MKQDCIFCQIIQTTIPAEIVWEDQNTLAFLDRFPKAAGHILIVPKKHYRYVFDLSEEEYLKLMKIVNLLAGKLKLATGAERITLKIMGKLVPHAHIHLLPSSFDGYQPTEFKKIGLKLRQALA
jgi:histidine triad (HIT) family protein